MTDFSRPQYNKEPPEVFARRVLSYPEPVALGYLTAWHDDPTHGCKCGSLEAHGGGAKGLLDNMRRHWAGRL